MSHYFSFFLKAGSEVHIHWKGAAEIILDSCTSWVDTGGSKHSMTPEKVYLFFKILREFCVHSFHLKLWS
jgi:P-type Ca2+ transporter type 2C